jgi:flagellar protein FlaG
MPSELGAQSLVRDATSATPPHPKKVASAANAESVSTPERRQGVAGPGQILPLEQGSSARSRTERPSDAELTAAVASLQDHVQNIQRDLQFSVDDETGTTVIKVIDPETEEVIRQIPPEEVIEISRSLEEVAGILLKAEA